MPGFVFQEILNHILQNPAYTIMHGAVAQKNKIKKNKKKRLIKKYIYKIKKKK